MKTTKGLLSLAAGGLGLALVSGCVVTAPPPPPPPPTSVEVTTTAPPDAGVDVADAGPVPDGYTWDGYEYVGVVGDQYYYLGPGNVWLVCDPVRLGRFHGWERYHADWRAHVIVNVRFRNDAHGHFHARADHGRPHDDHRHY